MGVSEMKQFKSAKAAKQEAQVFAKKFTVACIAAVMPRGGYRVFVFQHGNRKITQSGRAENLHYDLPEILQDYPDAEVMEFEVLRGDFWLSEVIE